MFLSLLSICSKTSSLVNYMCLLLSHIVAFKEGKPGDLELNELAGKIAAKWQLLGLYLRISQDVLDDIAANAEDKPYRMLLHWSRNTPLSSTPYRLLYDAMCKIRVGFSNLARDFCCKKTT